MKNNIKSIKANGIKFAFFDEGQGPTVLCLHGFPDSAEGFSPLAEQLVLAGYRVIRPYLRGYYPTAVAENKNYDIGVLADDVLDLIDQLADGKAIVIGHDWGALAAYVAAIKSPEKFEKLVVMNVPHMLHAEMSFKQTFKSWYVMFFQLPFFPLWQIKQKHFRFIDNLYTQWSPNWKFTDQDTQPVKNALAKPENLQGAIAYYRAMTRLSKSLWQLMNEVVSVRTFVIAGEADGSIDSVHFKNINKVKAAYSNLYDVRCYPKLGHFPHREAPELVAKDIIEFLREELDD